MKKLRVGITVQPVQGAGIWSNGINQNIAFLALLLRRLDSVESVTLINTSGGGRIDLPQAFGPLGLESATPAESTYRLDLLVEMGSAVAPEWKRRLSALGCKCVLFFVGHLHAGLAQSMVFGAPPTFPADPFPCDAAWILPQYSATGAPPLEALGIPVAAVPHIWSPVFLEAPPLHAAGHFGFDPARSARKPGGWRIGVFEPNISPAKTCVVPLLACAQAAAKHPACFADAAVQSSAHLAANADFAAFARMLEASAPRKFFFNARVPFAQAMAEAQIDAVLSHQWENAQNYLYYDALHGGYPLIHNSPILAGHGLGFFYPGRDHAAAAAALAQAWEQPAGFWEGYSRRASEFLATLDPSHPGNLAAFGAQIRALFEK